MNDTTRRNAYREVLEIVGRLGYIARDAGMSSLEGVEISLPPGMWREILTSLPGGAWDSAVFPFARDGRNHIKLNGVTIVEGERVVAFDKGLPRYDE